jgi:hypothetical protein
MALSGVAGDGAAGELGYARSVGVPNFSAAERERVAAVATVITAVGGTGNALQSKWW